MRKRRGRKKDFIERACLDVDCGGKEVAGREEEWLQGREVTWMSKVIMRGTPKKRVK